MPPVGFEPAISSGERPQTHALDRSATGTGSLWHFGVFQLPHAALSTRGFYFHKVVYLVCHYIFFLNPRSCLIRRQMCYFFLWLLLHNARRGQFIWVGSRLSKTVEAGYVKNASALSRRPDLFYKPTAKRVFVTGERDGNITFSSVTDHNT